MTTLMDPIRRTAELICVENPESSTSSGSSIELETRLKQDIFNSIARIKPDMTRDVDFDKEVMSGDFFTSLSPPLQGIAIARCEGTLAFYNRVGWHPNFLEAALDMVLPEDAIATFEKSSSNTRYRKRSSGVTKFLPPVFQK